MLIFFENIVRSALKIVFFFKFGKNFILVHFYRLLWNLKYQCKYIKVGNKHLFSNLCPSVPELRSAWKTSVAPFEDKNACIAEEMFLVAVY